LAESKDPMPACTTCGLPGSFYHGPRGARHDLASR
jgi:hypothetical protein